MSGVGKVQLNIVRRPQDDLAPLPAGGSRRPPIHLRAQLRPIQVSLLRREVRQVGFRKRVQSVLELKLSGGKLAFVHGVKDIPDAITDKPVLCRTDFDEAGACGR